MSIDNDIGSKLMYLSHVPDQKEQEESLSHCHVCLRKTKLTKEHIPPKNAFNEYNRLWDRLVVSNDKVKSRKTNISGGLWVKTLCAKCNNSICSPYANEYVKFVRQLVEKPALFDLTGDARIMSINLNTLFIAKEIASMILAIEELRFAQHRRDFRQFVMNPTARINPPFKIYAFLVPQSPESSTVARFHARVETFAPGYGFAGGEVSWFPFGFVYAGKIGKGYRPERMTDISNWFWENPKRAEALFYGSSAELLELILCNPYWENCGLGLKSIVFRNGMFKCSDFWRLLNTA